LATAIRPLRSQEASSIHHQRQRRTERQRETGTFILFDANQRICVLRPASRDMRTDVRSATSTMPSARRTKGPKSPGSNSKRHLTGKVLTNSPRMSSLHDVVKNRQHPQGMMQTCFSLKGYLQSH
jgi:hypothetical protein